MCGIFALLNNNGSYTYDTIKKEFLKGSNRGPEYSILQPEFYNYILGFHRLAINGLNPESHQPLILDQNLILICNGEIYNYKELYQEMKITPNTDSDCEVILHMYKRYGMSQTLRHLDGVFAFVLIDMTLETDEPTMYVARDPYGVRPLYILQNKDQSANTYENNFYGFASEMKCLVRFKQEHNEISQFPPGHYDTYKRDSSMSSLWKYSETFKYHDIGFQSIVNNFHHSHCMNAIYKNIIYYLKQAVFKRCSNSDRPIACLLSGGLDSSLICALVCEYNKTHRLEPPETYSIGLKGSQDLHYASVVANHLHTKHTSIELTEEEFVSEIDNVIYAIESYDTTTVRASIGNYLLGKYISSHSEAKVIMNGDGSDEVCGGYMYFHCVPDNIEFDRECYRLLYNIHKYDVLRSDKCISSHGLEPRTPFLDRSWVNYYMSIPTHIRNHNVTGKIEKFLLRRAFSEENYGSRLLPVEILQRSKEAFSDGVSKQTRSLYEIIQEHISKKDSIQLVYSSRHYLNATTDEQRYYISVFNKHYKDCGNVIDYYWMPQYVNAKDSSARTLNIYSTVNNNTNSENLEKLNDNEPISV
jgi:asparagine synthase (glutamine-hydrolysing)